MSYWHLFAGSVSMPVVVNGVHTHDALGIAQGLVGPVDRPPIEEDHYDDDTGERYDHVASWNHEPTDAEMDEVLARTWPKWLSEAPFATIKRSPDDPEWRFA